MRYGAHFGAPVPDGVGDMRCRQRAELAVATFGRRVVPGNGAPQGLDSEVFESRRVEWFAEAIRNQQVANGFKAEPAHGAHRTGSQRCGAEVAGVDEVKNGR